MQHQTSPILFIIGPFSSSGVLLSEIISAEMQIPKFNQSQTGDAVGGKVTISFGLWALFTLKNRSKVKIFVAELSATAEWSSANPQGQSREQVAQRLESKLVIEAKTMFIERVINPWEEYLRTLGR